MLISCLPLSGCGKKEAKPAPKPMAVTVMRLQPQTVRVYREYVGRTEAFLSVDLRPQATGYITGFFFREGQTVRKGQLLFQLDNHLYQAAVASAEARLARADADVSQAEAQLRRADDSVRRYAPLSAIEAIPAQQYTDALAEQQVRQAELRQMEANRGIAQASLQEAQVNLSYTQLRAPIAGVIGLQRMAAGGLASATESLPLATISQSNPVRVSFSLPDADYLKYLAPGKDAAAAKNPKHKGDSNGSTDMHWQLLLADGTVYDKPGKFFALSRAANLETDTVGVVLLYPNPDNRLRPGQYAKVRADVELRKNVLLVPVTCLRESQGAKTVSVLAPDDIAAQRVIETEERSGNSYIVTKGLNPGDLVIVGGEQKVKPGDKVKPQMMPQSADGPNGEPRALGAGGETQPGPRKAKAGNGADAPKPHKPGKKKE